MTALQQRAFTPLNLTEITPNGWLRHVLEVQASGLTGHLDEMWPDVAQSGWIGGEEEGWERAPYWLDGLVPLAWQLNDQRLKDKATRWIEHIIATQHEDGWLGTRQDRSLGASRKGGPRDYPFAMDPWPRFIVLKVLIQYFGATGDERIPATIERFLRKLGDVLNETPLRSWARMRWPDLLLATFWLYERTEEQWLLDLANLAQRQGFDWQTHANRFPFYTKVEGVECDLSSHGPNNAMGVKAGAVAWILSANDADRNASDNLIAALDRFHGQATGMFSCDEHLGGRVPTQGSELCAVVEYMFSLENLTSILGGVSYADRLERLAFNALPATISPDMWTHQYDQQVNQVICEIAQERVYTSNGPDANTFGLEPHFGCCTANMHQGWPKFTANLWMRNADDGLAAIAYAPCQLNTSINGDPVGITVETNYPFEDSVTITIAPTPTGFPLDLRIPAWADDSAISVNGNQITQPQAGTFHRLEITANTLTEIVLTFNPQVRIEHRSDRSVAVHRGSLLYALPIKADWREVVHRETVSDWELHPTTAWNLALDPSSSPEIATQRIEGTAFGPGISTTIVTLIGAEVPDWQIVRSAAGPLPDHVSTNAAQHVTLVPYGLTSLRVGEFPVL